jgi:DNA-binding CsgD family transcriptional regulator
MRPTPESAHFVGRQRELDSLIEVLHATNAGHGSLAFVAGEPGIGKTRLTVELTERARGQGWRVLLGRAYQGEGMPPYLPFREALREHMRTSPADELQLHLGRGAAEIGLLVPEVYDCLPVVAASPPVSPEYERYRLFESVTDALLNIARSSPPGLLLVLDDIHAADRPTLLLLHHLARKLSSAPLVVVATHRTVDIDRTDTLQDVLAELARDATCERIMLSPLSADAVATMLVAMTGSPVAPVVAETIYRESGGNPFFVREMVRHLQAEDRDFTDSETVAGGWGIPDGIRYVLRQRLARLSPAANSLLQTAAVLGDGFSFDVVVAAVDSDQERLLEALEENLRAGVLREEGTRYYFNHALIRGAVYHELSLPRRQRLHLRAATAFQSMYAGHLGPHLASLAAHYRLAGAAADPMAVLDFVQRAGAAAADIFAWEEAVTLWQGALDRLDELATAAQPDTMMRRGELLLDLGRVQSLLGDSRGARERYRGSAAVARHIGAADLLARAALGYGEVYVTGSDVDSFLTDLLEEALHRLGSEDSVLRAKVLAGLAMSLRYAPDPDRRAGLVRDAVAIARRTGDHAALAYALSAMHVANWQPGNVGERIEAATEAVKLAEAEGADDLAYWSHHWRAIDVLELGDIESLDVELRAHQRLAEELRAPYYIWNSLRLRATRTIMAGELDEGERLAEQALEIGRRVDPVDAHAMFTTQIWNIRLWQGRLEELLPDWERYCEYYRAIPAWRARLAWLYAEIGRPAEAMREIDRLTEHGFAALPTEMHWLAAVTFLAEACVRLGDTNHAAVLYEVMRPYSGFNVRSGGYPVSLACFGSASRPLGMLATTLGRWDAAERHFENAIALNTRMGAWPWVAHTQHAYSAMLLDRHAPGDLPQARMLLEQAISLYDRLGMEHYSTRARESLPAPRLTSAPSLVTYPDGLTQREVDVVRLIAAGYSNREIAATLVLSERTVERHIANIYEKLALRGKAARATVAAYAFQHRLASPTRHRASGHRST